jgi:uncharacterized protein YcbK (DUF882 family)
MTFEDWFAKQGFRNFSAKEFTDYFAITRRGVTNSAPPEHMWGHIVPTLRVVDDLRDFFGKPITILSSYRSAAYNAAIGDAAPKSMHKQFRALDISVKDKTPSQVFNQLRTWRDKGKFAGGLGLYPTFVHIDTRGSNATW